MKFGKVGPSETGQQVLKLQGRTGFPLNSNKKWHCRCPRLAAELNISVLEVRISQYSIPRLQVLKRSSACSLLFRAETARSTSDQQTTGPSITETHCLNVFASSFHLSETQPRGQSGPGPSFKHTHTHTHTLCQRGVENC